MDRRGSPGARHASGRVQLPWLVVVAADELLVPAVAETFVDELDEVSVVEELVVLPDAGVVVGVLAVLCPLVVALELALLAVGVAAITATSPLKATPLMTATTRRARAAA